MKLWKQVLTTVTCSLFACIAVSDISLAEGLGKGIVAVDSEGVHIQSDGEYLIDLRDILPGAHFERTITLENTTEHPVLLSFSIKEPKQISGPIHFDESLAMSLTLDKIPFFEGVTGGTGVINGKAFVESKTANMKSALFNYALNGEDAKEGTVLEVGDGVTVTNASDTTIVKDLSEPAKDSKTEAFKKWLEERDPLSVEELLTLITGNDVPLNLQEKSLALTVLQPGEKAVLDATFDMDSSLTNEDYTEKSITENKWVFTAEQAPEIPGVTTPTTPTKPATKIPQFGDMGGNAVWFIIIGSLVVLIGVTYTIKKMHEKDGEGSHE